MSEDDRLLVADAAPPQRIDGCCRKEIAPGTQPAATGICPRYYLRLERDDTWTGDA